MVTLRDQLAALGLVDEVAAKRQEHVERVRLEGACRDRVPESRVRADRVAAAMEIRRHRAEAKRRYVAGQPVEVVPVRKAEVYVFAPDAFRAKVEEVATWLIQERGLSGETLVEALRREVRVRGYVRAA